MKKAGTSIAALAAVAGSACALLAGTAGAHTASAAAGLPQLNLALTGKSIAVSGSTVSGAVTVQSTVTGVKQAEPTLLRLEPGVTFAQVFGAVQRHHGDPNYLSGLASIVFDVNANKGVSTAQTTLEPGTYEAIDTQGNNPAKWPHTQFTVTQSSSPAALPRADATVGAIEFNFVGPKTLRNGQLVRWENDGFLVHMIFGIGVKNAADAKKVTALLQAGKDNQAQKLATAFVPFSGPISPGGLEQSKLQAKPGVYVLVCFMDTQDGREHTQLGMERTIRIK